MSVDTIRSWANSAGYSPRAGLALGKEVDKAYTAAATAIKDLDRLIRIFETGTDDDVLVALRSLASHAGYSNSALTAVGELWAASGGVAAILEAAP